MQIIVILIFVPILFAIDAFIFKCIVNVIHYHWIPQVPLIDFWPALGLTIMLQIFLYQPRSSRD